jgi:hypothetical protein
MAQMVPKGYGPKTTYSERQVFEALATLPDTCVVLHRLQLPRHATQAQGEADFVVICHRGVLCLEVKGGSVAQREGEWFFGDDPRPQQSPFTQASDNMHSLRGLLDRHRRRLRGDLPDPLVACGVVLPHVTLEPSPGESDSTIVQEILLDSSHGLGDIASYLDRCFAYWEAALRDRARPRAPLDRAGAHAIKQVLRGTFELMPGVGFWLDRADELLRHEEQEERLRYLDVAGAEPRIVVCGVAGSGKTSLALEYARQRAATGAEVLFLCFNRNLRGYLEGQIDARVMAYNFHDYLEADIPSGRLPPAPPDDAPRSRYYGSDLPQAYLRYARETGNQATWDCLVVDEAQDLMRPDYLECMDAMLRGGLRDGRWHMTYDANQDLYNRGSAETLQLLVRETHAYRYPLQVNQRNTAAVALFNRQFSGLDCGRPRIAIYRPAVEATPYRSREHQLELIADAARSLLAAGVARRGIVILGRRTMANSCFGGDGAALGADLPVVDLGNHLTTDSLMQDSLKYCTIWGYKGIDAPAVLLVDVDERTFGDKLLCHTGASRARTVLRAFYDQALLEQMSEVIAGYQQALAAGQPVAAR